MGVIGGDGGAVDSANTVGLWQITSSQDLKKIVASNTDGAPKKLAGVGDWSGRWESWDNEPAVLPGVGFTFIGIIDQSVTGGAGKGATGPAICDSFELTINIETGEVVKHVVNFSSNGALTQDNVTAADATTPDPDSSLDCKIEESEPLGTPSYSEITNITTITITITAENVSYSDSSTDGETLRLGGPIDATISYTQNVDAFADFLVVGATHQIKVFVNASEFWEFEFVMVESITDVEVNTETGVPVKGTVNLSFTGFTDISATPTKGEILKPSGGAIWP